MQQNNQTISDFVRRTDALADRSGLILSDLPSILGFSKPMLFAYRSGKNRITSKVWLKLERAECDYGITSEKKPPPDEITALEGNLNEFPEMESGNVLREDPVTYKVKPRTQEIPKTHMETLLERIADALENLVEIERRKNPPSQ